MGKRNDVVTRQRQLHKAKEGIAKHFQNVSSLTLGGFSITTADLTALIEADLAAMDSLGNLRAATAVGVKQAHDAHAKVEPLLRCLRDYVKALFGTTAAAAATLEDFGFKPHREPTRTLQAKNEAQAKTAATRKARHTLGEKQKLAIKGEIPTSPATPKP